MAARYTLKVVTDFAAAHSLRNYQGSCERLHGHNWKVEVEVSARTLDEVGMGLDFKTIRRATNDFLDHLDHYNLNDVPPFDTINPTAENIAAYIFKGLSEKLNNERVSISAITLWETERACVRYSEDE
ncbi:MAG: 6-carboxytetrahydropterin synthase QueD [Gammaproteobacteria bacterium]|nr:6-carboxytetrahydropterin synthase QueD [Gammaproteobacteria bacterium]MDH5728159.1 6-carboxytetrahydropterin synthase QueD [Gammaproteobacteria bacterium]